MTVLHIIADITCVSYHTTLRTLPKTLL